MAKRPQPGPVPAPPSVPSLRSERKFSVKAANASDDLLTSLEEGHVDDVRRLVLKLPEGITSALNTPSLLVKHKLRTPLMAAAATGDFAKFTAILNAFNRQYDNKLVRDFEMRLQLANRDRAGMTAAMLGARSGNVSIVAALMTEIEETEALLSLEARDHRHMTLLMHAASVGPAPVFHEVQEAILSSMHDNDEGLGRQLLLKSADDKTILMHAASSGDAMLLKTVAGACRSAIPPHKVREMLVDQDSDGLNILMHAASCQTAATAASLVPAEVEQEDDNPEESEEEDEEGDDITPGDSNNNNPDTIAQDSGTSSPTASTTTAITAATPNTGLFGVPPGSAALLGGLGAAAASAATTATATAGAATAAAASTADAVAKKAGATAAAAAAAAAAALRRTGGVTAEGQAAVDMPKVVPVFKAAFRLITQCLWKDKVLEQLKATDLWGRNVLTHALLSGHKLMFEAALGAVRDVVTDEEASEMLETNEGEREDEPMISALDQGETDMRKLFALRVGQIKNDVDARSKLSSIDAKIESFIPGKLVVMFQLLLPQIAIRSQLSLLFIMCAIAPILKLATFTAKAGTGSSKNATVVARTGKLSLFLGAPAMFFWGVGTSNVGTTSNLGWSPALCATAMAVATICIPAIDAFFYSSSAARWADKISCTEWRFNFKAYRQWFWARVGSGSRRPNAVKKNGGHEVLPSYATFGREPVPGLRGVEEEKFETTAAPTPVVARMATSSTTPAGEGLSLNDSSGRDHTPLLQKAP